MLGMYILGAIYGTMFGFFLALLLWILHKRK